MFAFDEMGGSRHVAGTGTPDCRTYRLEAGQTITSPIKKWGMGYSGDAQPSDFDRWFVTDPSVHLPAGKWTITASAVVWPGTCPTAAIVTLRAAVTGHVSD